MNVLVSSSGRRTSLVAAFQAAVAPGGGRVFTADIDPLAPTHFVGDGALRVPPADAPDHLAVLADLVAEHEVGIVVPTIDTDLPGLAAARAEFDALRCVAVVSSAEFVALAADKLGIGHALAADGIAYPRTWPAGDLPAELPTRVVSKPRRGSASKGVRFHDGIERPGPAPIGEDVVVQEFVAGPEITVDALFDLDGRLLHCVPRRRLRTLAGESIQGVTIDAGPIADWLRSVLPTLGSWGAKGPITLQAILADGGPMLIDVNPRFGGGFPLSHAAGARYPEWLVDLVEGRPVAVEPFDYAVGLYMTRSFGTEFIVERPAW